MIVNRDGIYKGEAKKWCKKIIKGKSKQFGSGTGVRFGTTGSIRGTVSNY